jgi:hypothetical protein
MDERIKEETRSEWRELGFFYDRKESSKEWLLVGSRTGLRRFAALLRAFVADRNEMKSEHEHYGPYMYLEVMTWPDAGIDRQSIHGSLKDLGRLAELVEEQLAGLTPGRSLRIREEFAPTAEYTLVLELRDDSFDPASADGNLVGSAATLARDCFL